MAVYAWARVDGRAGAGRTGVVMRRSDDEAIITAVNRILDCEFWLTFGVTEIRERRLQAARDNLADRLESRDFHRALVELPSVHWSGARLAYRDVTSRYRERYPPLGFMRWAASTSVDDLQQLPHIGKIGAAAISLWGRRMWGCKDGSRCPTE